MTSSSGLNPIGPSAVDSNSPVDSGNTSWKGRACKWLKSAGSKIVELFKKIIYTILPFCRPKNVVVPNNTNSSPPIEESDISEDEEDPIQIPKADLKVFKELRNPATNPEKIPSLLKKLKKMAPQKTANMDEETRQAYIDQIDKLRAPYFGSNKIARDDYFRQLNSISLLFITKNMSENLSKDLSFFEGSAVKKNDGQITRLGKSTIGDIPDQVLSEAWKAALPNSKVPHGLKFKFQQVQALSQVNGSNNLCGYYALFFLLQSVLKQSLFNEDAREFFNTQLNDWMKIKARKSLEAKLEKMEALPLEIDIPDDYISSLTAEEICEIMKNNDHLKDKANWFVIDAEEITAEKRAVGLDEVDNIYPAERNQMKSDLPLFLVVKQSNGHYYFVKVDKTINKPFKCTIAHSLSGNVAGTWNEKHWTDLLHYIFRVGKF